MSELTAREHFTHLLTGLPLAQADAIVVFTGDGLTRLPSALQAFRQGAAPMLIVTGGLVAEPYSVSAQRFKESLIEDGVAPDRILCDTDSMHTRANCDFVSWAAKTNGWTRLLLCTSHYHMPRAYLTMLASLRSFGSLASTLVLPLSVTAPWFVPVAVVDCTRAALLQTEAEKVAEYQAKGDCMSYEDALAYLAAVEGGA